MQAVSKYRMIYQHFVNKIKCEELKDGEQLPTENALCDLFDVSRVTVRKALDELAHEGYIIKKHSRGSFVRVGMASMCLDSLLGFTEEMNRRGLTVATKVNEISLEHAGNFYASKLDIDERSKVYIIERLRFVENEPMAIERVVLPHFHCPDLSKHDLSQSLYHLLEQEYRLRSVKANEILEAAAAKKKEAEALHIRIQSPVLKIERSTFLPNHIPLEYTVSVYRGDKYKFHVTMNK